MDQLQTLQKCQDCEKDGMYMQMINMWGACWMGFTYCDDHVKKARKLHKQSPSGKSKLLYWHDLIESYMPECMAS